MMVKLTMTRAEYSDRGPIPEEQLTLVQRPIPNLSPGDMLVAVRAAPINPSDLLAVTGRYGLLPPLPAVAGNEGVGDVVAVGQGVSPTRIGERVVIPPGYGTWTTHVVVPAAETWAVSREADPLQLAMVRVNPPTAALLLRSFVTLKPGEWVVQNAATSAVGCYVIQLARHWGLRTLNIVRRESDIEWLGAEGADAVVVDGPELGRRLAAQVGDAKIRLGLDAVGGKATDQIASALAPGGTVVHYGASGGESSRISPRSLIFRDITVRGFWLVHWFRNAPPTEQSALYTELSKMIETGSLSARIANTFPLSDLHNAVIAARQEARSGKVLLTP